MRESGPAPMLSAYAVRSLTASTSRKSSACVPGIVSACHVAPPSAVRSTVPAAPLAQTTSLVTALTPRSLAVTPLVWSDQCGPGDAASQPAASAAATNVNVFTRAFCHGFRSLALSQNSPHSDRFVRSAGRASTDRSSSRRHNLRNMQRVGWFRVIRGRLEYCGRITRTSFVKWCATNGAEASCYMDALASLCYADALPRAHVALHRLVLVPRAMVAGRAQAGVCERLSRLPALAGLDETLRRFFLDQ